MRFNAEAYAKVFPKVETPEVIESSVPAFTPTTDKVEESEVAEVAEEEGGADGDGEHRESGTEQ